MSSPKPKIIVFNNMVTPYTNRLFSGLVEAGVDLKVASCVEQEANRSWASAIEKKFDFHVFSGFTIKLATSRYAHINTGIYRYLNHVKPEALIVGGFYPSMLIAASWAIIHQKPLGLATDGWRHTMPQTLYHRIVRSRLAKRCRVIIACGKKGAQYFREEGIADAKIKIVPLVPAWDAPPIANSFSDRPFDVIWAAHINDDVKNASFFAEVIVRLKALKPNVSVRLVGKGPAEEAVLARLTEAGVAWRHDGVVDWRSMHEVFSSGRVLLLPSLWEPWGLVCNEAMQCGTPCVVSPFVGAAGDLVIPSVNGEICELDAGVWARKTHSILKDPERWAQLARHARVASETRSLDNSVTQYQSALSLLVHSERRM